MSYWHKYYFGVLCNIAVSNWTPIGPPYRGGAGKACWFKQACWLMANGLMG